MQDYHVTSGDVSESLSIMREAAQWLVDTGKPLWALDGLTREQLNNPPASFLVLWDGSDGVATLILSFEDNFFWPELPAGSSGFIHKLAVRRSHAGQGAAKALIAHCADACKEKGVQALRLDCDPHRKGLCDFYEKCGFAFDGAEKTIHIGKPLTEIRYARRL